MHSLYEFLPVGIVAKSAPRQGNNAIQGRRRDVTMTPDRVEQLVAGEQVTRPHQQLLQKGEYLRLEREVFAAAGEATIGEIDLPFVAAVDDLIQKRPPYARRPLPRNVDSIRDSVPSDRTLAPSQRPRFPP